MSKAMNVAVISVEPVTDAMRAKHRLSPDALLAVVEHYQGRSDVLTTDDQCRQGVLAAARAWAETTGAAYAGAA